MPDQNQTTMTKKSVTRKLSRHFYFLDTRLDHRLREWITSFEFSKFQIYLAVPTLTSIDSTYALRDYTTASSNKCEITSHSTRSHQHSINVNDSSIPHWLQYHHALNNRLIGVDQPASMNIIAACSDLTILGDSAFDGSIICCQRTAPREVTSLSQAIVIRVTITIKTPGSPFYWSVKLSNYAMPI